jgi:peptidyl-prolyl cis-trans isomerase C
MSALRYVALPLLLSALLVAGCGKKFSDDTKVLATVNGEKITEQDYDNYLQLRQSQQPPIPDKEKERKVVLDEMVDRILLTQHGAETGVEETPEVHFRLKRVRENLLAQEVIRKTLKETPVTDEDLKKRFDKELEDTHKTEYKARHILVKTEDEAKDVASQLKAGKSFEQLAKTRSIDPESGKKGGDLGWVSQGTGFVPEFFTALTTMKKGQVSEPVKSDFGWHVIKVDNARALKLPSWEEFMADPRAPAGLRRRIQEERVQEVLKDLKTKAKVEFS